MAQPPRRSARHAGVPARTEDAAQAEQPQGSAPLESQAMPPPAARGRGRGRAVADNSTVPAQANTAERGRGRARGRGQSLEHDPAPPPGRSRGRGARGGRAASLPSVQPARREDPRNASPEGESFHLDTLSSGSDDASPPVSPSPTPPPSRSLSRSRPRSGPSSARSSARPSPARPAPAGPAAPGRSPQAASPAPNVRFRPAVAASTPARRVGGRRRAAPRVAPPTPGASARAARHARTAQVAESGPAGTKGQDETRDVFEFYEDVGHGRRDCVFCRHIESLGKARPNSRGGNYGPKTASGTMRSHLIVCHRDSWIRACKLRNIKHFSQGGLSALAAYNAEHGEDDEGQNIPSSQQSVPPWSRRAFVDALCGWVTVDDQALNAVENPHFRLLVRMLKDGLKDEEIPHRTTLYKRIQEMCDELLDNFERDIKDAVGLVSFTLDIWSDPNLRPFMAITAHWVQAVAQDSDQGSTRSLRLRADLIAFQEMPGRHTGAHICHAFLRAIDRLGLDTKIGWITMDNASNNDTFIEALAFELDMRGIPFDSIKRHIRCFPHIVNLACDAILGEITDMDWAKLRDPPVDYDPTRVVNNQRVQRDPIAIVRNLVRAIRASSLRRQAFRAIEKRLGLHQWELLRDVITRWSSTLLMINRAISLRTAIDDFFKDANFTHLREKWALTSGDWKRLQDCAKILMVPHAYQQTLSAEKTPSLHQALPNFERMLRRWAEQRREMPHMASVIDAGMEKIELYRERVAETPAYLLAMAVNPEEKLSFFPAGDAQEVAKNKLIEELHSYRQQDASPATPSRDRSSGTTGDASWADAILGRRSNAEPEPDLARSIRDEVEAYLRDRVMPRGGDILQYWLDNQFRYPTLFALAMDIIPIQGSSVPCERVFSSAKETMTDRRNRIEPKLMEALQLLKFSLRKGNYALSFTSHLSAEDTTRILDEEAAEAIAIPEDMETFIASLEPTEASDEVDEVADIMNDAMHVFTE